MNAKVGVEQTFTNSFILVGQGTAAKLIVQEFGDLTVNPDGTVTVTFINTTFRCM